MWKKRNEIIAIIILSLFSMSKINVGQVSETKGYHQLIHYKINGEIVPSQKILKLTTDVAVPNSYMQKDRIIRLDLASADVKENGENIMTVESVLDSEGNEIHTQLDTLNNQLLFNAGEEQNENYIFKVNYLVEFDERSIKYFDYYLYSATGQGNYFYPMIVNEKGEHSHFQDFYVSISYPENYSLLTSGILIQSEAIDGKKYDHYSVEHIEGFAIAFNKGFVLQSHVKDGIKVTAFSDSAGVEKFKGIAETALDAALWYRKIYGFFPIHEIGIVQGGKKSSGGYPLPNIFMVHQRTTNPDYLSWITAHELGHYYWGLYVLDDTERLDWLMLANGIWIDQLYMAQCKGITLEEQWRQRRNGDFILDYLIAMLGNRELKIGIPSSEEKELGFDYNSLIRHGKAATGVYLQAQRIGVEKFLNLQKEIIADYKYKPLSEADFIQRLESAGCKNASEFFTQWKRGDSNFSFVVEEVTDSTVIICRNGNVPYPLDIELVGQKSSKIIAFPIDAKRDTLKFIDDKIVDVKLDPYGITPMWNSSNQGIKSLFIEAFYYNNFIDTFISLAEKYLKETPKDERIRKLLNIAKKRNKNK